MSDERSSANPYGEHHKIPTASILEDIKNEWVTQSTEDQRAHDAEIKNDKPSHSRNVFDPVTQREVTIRDASRSDLERIMKNQATSDLTIQGKLQQDDTTHRQEQAANILLHPLPPPDWSGSKTLAKKQLNRLNLVVLGSGVIAMSFVLQGYSPIGISIILILGVICANHRTVTLVDTIIENTALESENLRGQSVKAGAIPEACEWLNRCTKVLWPLVNDELFVAISDVLEDIMQQNVPAIVQMVKVVELNQGRNPARLLSIRSLENEEVKDMVHNSNYVDDDQTAGDWANIEVAFAYHGINNDREVDKTENARLLIELYFGIKKLQAIKMPVWVQLTGMIGTARIRCQMIPDPPFVKHVTLTFMGLPRVTISAAPLLERMPNVMNFPLISSFVHSSIDAAMKQYVAPKSITLDVAELLYGDGIKKTTDAFGVLYIHIKRARDLEKADTRGSSDPYILIEWSKIGRPLYSSRVVVNCLDPYYEETAFLLVNTAAVASQEYLSVQLWDSDRISKDDELGHVEVPLYDLIREKGKQFDRSDTLKGLGGKKDKQGVLEWSVGFYHQHRLDTSRGTDGVDPHIPADIKINDEVKDFAAAANHLKDVLFVPPNPELPSGILAITVVQIVDLGVRDTSGTFGNRKGMQIGQVKATDVPPADDESSPSSYFTLFVNDERIYKSRTKPVTRSPFFNAGTERFIPDWRTATVTIVVRDQRMRESNPVLGIVQLRLSEVLTNASCVQRFFPLSAGIGHGRVKIGLLFKSVELQLPEQLLGWNTGVMCIKDGKVTVSHIAAEFQQKLSGARVCIETGVGEVKMKDSTNQDNEIVWTKLNCHGELLLPVKRRISGGLKFLFYHRALARKPFAAAIQWMNEIDCEEEKEIELDLCISDRLDLYIQNHHPSDMKIEDMPHSVRSIGKVKLKLTFEPGLTRQHGNSSQEQKEVQEVVTAVADAEVEDSARTDMTRQTSRSSSSSEGNILKQFPSSDSDSDGDPNASKTTLAKAKNRLSKIGEKYREKRAERQMLHREERGSRSIKAVRTLDWMGSGVASAAHKIRKSVELKPREPDIETEVMKIDKRKG